MIFKGESLLEGNEPITVTDPGTHVSARQWRKQWWGLSILGRTLIFAWARPRAWADGSVHPRSSTGTKLLRLRSGGVPEEGHRALRGLVTH